MPAAAAELQRTYQFTFGASTGNAPYYASEYCILYSGEGYPVYQGNNYKAYYITGSDAYRSTCDSTTDRTATCLCKLPPSPPPPSPPPPCQAYACTAGIALSGNNYAIIDGTASKTLTKAWCEAACCDAASLFPAGSMPATVDGYSVHTSPPNNAVGFASDQACTGYEWSTTAQYGRCILSGYDFESDPSIIGTYSNYELCRVAHPPSAPPPSPPPLPDDFVLSSSQWPAPATGTLATCVHPGAIAQKLLTAQECQLYATYGGYTYQPVGFNTVLPAGCSIALDGVTVQFNSLTDDDPGDCGENIVSACLCKVMPRVTSPLQCEAGCYSHIFHDALLGGGRREIRPSPNGAAGIQVDRAFVLNAPTDGELSSFSGLGRMADINILILASANDPLYQWAFAWPLEDGGNGYLGMDPASSNHIKVWATAQRWKLHADTADATSGLYFRSTVDNTCLAINGNYADFDTGGSLADHYWAQLHTEECNFNSPEQRSARL